MAVSFDITSPVCHLSSKKIGAGPLNNFAHNRRAARSSSVIRGLFATALLAGCSLSGSQPVGYQAQIEVAEQFLQNRQFEQGYRILETVSEDMTRVPEAQIDVAEAYLRADAHLRAEQAYARANELGANYEARLGTAKLALARNDAPSAKEKFRAILAERPGDTEAMNGLGVAFDLSGEHHLAQVQYREALALKPSYYEAMNNLGLSLVLGGNAQSGAEVLGLLTASKLDDDTIRQNLAIAFAMSGRTDDALKLATADMSKDEAAQLFDAVKYYRRSKS